jgi:hypothetical protein
MKGETIAEVLALEVGERLRAIAPRSLACGSLVCDLRLYLAESKESKSSLSHPHLPLAAGASASALAAAQVQAVCQHGGWWQR